MSSRTSLPEGMPTADEIKALQQAKAEHIRESWVRTMEVRLVKTELNKCYRGEGVNAKQFCKELAERYVNMLRDNQIKGFTVIDKE